MMLEFDFIIDEEEILFINIKKINGFIQKFFNGVLKYIKIKLWVQQKIGDSWFQVIIYRLDFMI